MTIFSKTYLLGALTSLITVPLWGIELVEIVEVIDGDTVKAKSHIRGTENYRLEGIDTPEISSRYKIQPYGEEAKQHLESILTDKRNFGFAWVEVTEYADRWGRPVAIFGCLFCHDTNVDLVKNGLAFVEYASGEYEKKLDRALTYAKVKKVNIWSQDSPVSPKTWRKSMPR